MKYLKVKDIIVEEDKREQNLIKNDIGEIIDYKQSKCTVRFIFEEINGNKEEYCWVKENKDLAKAIELIAKNEEKKYKVNGEPIPEKEIIEFPSGRFLLGRYLFFLSWLYPLYDKFLIRFGLNVPEKYLSHAIKNKNREENANKN